MIYFGKINTFGCSVALELLLVEIGHDVLIKIKIEDRGDLNNEMSAM